MSNKLPAGMYLVGRQDGSAAEFFARITESRDVIVPPDKGHEVDNAINTFGLWWWREMHVLDFLPAEGLLFQMPPHHEEDKHG